LDDIVTRDDIMVRIMAYDPYEHIPTKRGILAAWLVCLVLVVSGLGVTAPWRESATLLHHRYESDFAQRPIAAPSHRA
jgi:hypothetical protein